METTLAILMALGIFLVGPALIGFALVGALYLFGRPELRAQRAKAVEEAVAEALREQPAEARGEAAAGEPEKVYVKVA
jgi:hypothetical protein